MSAVDNAHEKADQICSILGRTLGPPLLVREEETKEWKNEEDEDGGGDSGGVALSILPRVPVITVSSRVSVFFGLGRT